jgi:hypothetical protein
MAAARRGGQPVLSERATAACKDRSIRTTGSMDTLPCFIGLAASVEMAVGLTVNLSCQV